MSVPTEAKALGAFVPSRSQRRGAVRETSRLRRDPHRRRKYLSRVRAHDSIVRSAICTLEALLAHSDDSAKPAWPSQKTLAAAGHVDVRTVRRHLAELRAAGFLLVFVYEAVRDPETGRYRRRRTNRYYFCIPAEPASGHRVRRNRSSHLEDTGGLLNPSRIKNPRRRGGRGGSLAIENISGDLARGKWSDEKGCVHCDFTGWVFDEHAIASPCSCSTKN